MAAGNVARSPWSSPPPSTQARGSVPSRGCRTEGLGERVSCPDPGPARHGWPRPAWCRPAPGRRKCPSLLWLRSCAPAARRRGAAPGGIEFQDGRSSGGSEATGWADSSSASPAAAQPALSGDGQGVAGRAPDRSTGWPPSSVPRTRHSDGQFAATAEVAAGDGAAPAPSSPMARVRPSARSSTHPTGVSGGMVRLTTMEVAGRPWR